MKNINVSKKLIKKAESVFLAMAYTQMVRPIVEKYQKEIVKETPFFVSDEVVKIDLKYIINKRILSPNEMYLADEESSERYFNLLDKAAADNGFKVKRRYCPLLIAENLEREAKNELLKEAEYITNIDPNSITKMDYKKELVELILKLCANYINIEELTKNSKS